MTVQAVDRKYNEKIADFYVKMFHNWESKARETMGAGKVPDDVTWCVEMTGECYSLTTFPTEIMLYQYGIYYEQADIVWMIKDVPKFLAFKMSYL